MNHEYISRDLGEVVALVTSGCFYTSIQWKDSNAYFVFQPAAEAVGQQYLAGALQVNARTYYDNLRMIKRKIYANSRTPRRRENPVETGWTRA